MYVVIYIYVYKYIYIYIKIYFFLYVHMYEFTYTHFHHPHLVCLDLPSVFTDTQALKLQHAVAARSCNTQAKYHRAMPSYLSISLSPSPYLHTLWLPGGHL